MASEQKTEKATPRRIEKARKEGQFATSREFVSALQFLGFVAVCAAWGGEALERARQTTRFLISRAFAGELGVADVLSLFHALILPDLAPLIGAGALLVALTLMVQLATTRMGLSVAKLAPDPKRMNPIQRLRGLPGQNLPVFLQALVLIPVFGLAVYSEVKTNLDAFLALPAMGIDHATAVVGGTLKLLLWRAAGLFLVFGFADLIWQRVRFMRQLRMTKQEIREEAKEQEGNPQVKMKIRRIQRDLARRQMMKQVPQATAVVVNPTHYAVAIRYSMESQAAPKVVAKGKNYLAKRIRRIAVEHLVPIVENPPLAQALYKSVDVGQEIPPHLYRAVAEILAYIYKLMGGKLPG